MRVRYQVVASKAFRAKVCKALNIPKYPSHYLEGVIWTLSRDPHCGKQASENVWVFKVIWPPIGVEFYYTVNDAKKKVHLLDAWYPV